MKQLKIAFIHPDMGIGGAEQLIVNLALAFQKKGHQVKIFTPYHNPKHCFKETIDGTIDVEVRGDLIPASFFGKCIALCAFLRMFLASIYLIFLGLTSKSQQYDVVVVDQVSFSVPLLRLFGYKIFFYCHFPDKLLCTERKSIFKKIYRFVLDFLEEICLIPCNVIVVNSQYTKQTFLNNFAILNYLKINPDILYPAIDFSKFQKFSQISEKSKQKYGSEFFLSLNRYERKKNVELAIRSYALFKAKNKNSNIKLVIAGGYDPKGEYYKYFYRAASKTFTQLLVFIYIKKIFKF